jgi:dTDP-4-amino-4,6-dideoxygalactose transaminase
MMPMNEWNEPNCWLSCIYLSGKVKPQDVIAALNAENIESRPVWKPMHMQPYFAGCDFIGEGVSERIFENGICLPSDTKMSNRDLRRITETIKALWL